MGKDYARGERVAEQIRRELAELLRLEVKDPRVSLVTITAVELSPDYAHAKVYFSSLQGPESASRIGAGLSRAAGFLRRELGRRIRLHAVPELHFAWDESIDRGARLSKLIDEALEADRQHPE